MSETSARASRFAFWFGSLARNGLIGARLAGAPGVEPPAAAEPPAGPAGAPAGRDGAGTAGAGAPARGAKVGRSAVLERAAGIGAVLETVGRIGDGSPPFDGPTLGAARPAPPEAAAAGNALAEGGPAGACRGGIAGGTPAAGRWAGIPSGAVGATAAAGGTNGRGAPVGPAVCEFADGAAVRGGPTNGPPAGRGSDGGAVGGDTGPPVARTAGCDPLPADGEGG